MTPHSQVSAALTCGRCPTPLSDPSDVLASPAVLLVVDRAPCVRRASHSHRHWLLCFGHTALVFQRTYALLPNDTPGPQCWVSRCPTHPGASYVYEVRRLPSCYALLLQLPARPAVFTSVLTILQVFVFPLLLPHSLSNPIESQR